MKAYYHARAHEYDDWWLGRGLYAGRERPGWEDELAELRATLAALPPVRTLDVACGTGAFFTCALPGEVTGLDQSEAMIELARENVPGATFVVGDALSLPFPGGAFDRLFTSYFYCHGGEPERQRFLDEAHRVARELVVVGSHRHEGEAAERWEERTLQDGTTWQVFKRVFEPEALAAELAGRVIHAGRWFVAVAA